MFQELEFLKTLKIKSTELVRYSSVLVTSDSRQEKHIANIQERAKCLPELLLKGKFEELRETWIYSSSYLIDMYGLDVIKRIFLEIGDLSMDFSDVDFLDGLSEELLIYRAGSDDGISWTPYLTTAEMHSELTGHEIIKKTINKNEIKAAYVEENEVIYFKD